MSHYSYLKLGMGLVLGLVSVRAQASGELPQGATGWLKSGRGMVRGVTVGPIENALFPGRGYGSEASAQAMRAITRMGGNWVSITVFGRVLDRNAVGVSSTFEAPFAENRVAVARAVGQAHAAGLRVLLVPHLWVESGTWRGEIDPGDDESWRRWETSYASYVRGWAEVARDAEVDMFAVGVELRSWVTTTRAPSFLELIHEVRSLYPGLITYASNWDDAKDAVILGELDVIGVNAFFPLSSQKGARLTTLARGAGREADRLAELAQSWGKPILFTEFGYTTRRDCAIEPWLWPEQVKGVMIDQKAQAEAYFALLSALVNEPWFAGFFVWRLFADTNDMTQEPEWGFSPHGKWAEAVLSDAFAARWAADGEPHSPFAWAERAHWSNVLR